VTLDKWLRNIRIEAGAVQWQSPRQPLHEEADMRPLFVRALIALTLAFVATDPTRTWAQAPGPGSLAPAIEPGIPTMIESLLATPNLVLVADYYRIDMRFGPSMRIDALVVEAVDSRTRVKGLRVQVRDPENRSRQEGTSFIDFDELTGLSRLSSMAELATKWTHDDRRRRSCPSRPRAASDSRFASPPAFPGRTCPPD